MRQEIALLVSYQVSYPGTTYAVKKLVPGTVPGSVSLKYQVRWRDPCVIFFVHNSDVSTSTLERLAS